MKITALKTRVQKGFTLVELLVVIGILGVLAAALLATLDPIQQLKKSQDAAARAIAEEFTKAAARYYANHNDLPWEGATPACVITLPDNITAMGGPSGATCTAALVNDGELKNTFDATALPNYMEAQGAAPVMDMTVSSPTPGTTTICFRPQSKAQLANVDLTIYNNIGAVTPGGGYQCISQ